MSGISLAAHRQVSAHPDALGPAGDPPGPASRHHTLNTVMRVAPTTVSIACGVFSGGRLGVVSMGCGGIGPAARGVSGAADAAS